MCLMCSWSWVSPDTRQCPTSCGKSVPEIFRGQLAGQHVLQTWIQWSTCGISWINVFGGLQTHAGQSRSSPSPWLRSGRISILGQPVGLSEACPGIVEHALRHVGLISAINVSFQYHWMNGRNFGTNPYLDYHIAFQHDFGHLSSNGYTLFALANFAQFCSR